LLLGKIGASGRN